jgi:hypothetical protein
MREYLAREDEGRPGKDFVRLILGGYLAVVLLVPVVIVGIWFALLAMHALGWL